MNIVIFDTETIGKVSQDLLNVGYKIIDLNIQNNTYKTLQERDYVITELINNKVYCLNDDFVGQEKYDMIQNSIANKTCIKRSLKQIFKTMENDLIKHKVLFGYAYNCNFDIDKFKKSAEKFNLQNPLRNIPIFDIWAYATNYICLTNDYIEWAKENKILTPSEKYIQTSVEGVCKYLYKNINFVEDHTALSDVQHETNILLECVKRGCDITREDKKVKSFISSEKVFTECIIINGKEIEIKYTNKYTRENKTYYLYK